MSTQQFSDADRLGGRPKGKPVLEAIDRETWPSDTGRCMCGEHYITHNDSLERIRAAYLQNHPQGPEVSGRTTRYYVCPQCKTPIDMIGTGSDGLVAPSDGREFDRYIRENWVEAFAELFDDLISAHNADRAADKQRIAELEAQLRLIMSAIPCGNISTHTPENAPGRIRDLVSECSRLEGVIEELISAAQNPRVMKRWGVDGVPKIPIGAYSVHMWVKRPNSIEGVQLVKLDVCNMRTIESYSKHCPDMLFYSHYLELEPTPNLPTDETSDDMSSLAGDGDA